MKKAIWGAFLLMTTLAAAGLCETDYTLSNPHIRYEKIEGARQEEAAQADGAGISLSDMAAAEDAQSAAQSADTWPKTFTVTLGGDTTLGSTDDLRKREDCFENVAADKGYGWFFSGLQTLFATDDLTLVNFEGTLTEETSKKEKLYNFKGPAEYTDILTLGSVEAVNIANNHTLDYGQQGKADTIANLEAAGIVVSGGGELGVFEKNGVKVGMTGYCFPYKGGKKDISADVKALREAGCQIVIASFHWGSEYRDDFTGEQRTIGRAAIKAGADIVVGTHPHIVQGIEAYPGQLHPLFAGQSGVRRQRRSRRPRRISGARDLHRLRGSLRRAGIDRRADSPDRAGQGDGLPPRRRGRGGQRADFQADYEALLRHGRLCQRGADGVLRMGKDEGNSFRHDFVVPPPSKREVLSSRYCNL